MSLILFSTALIRNLSVYMMGKNPQLLTLLASVDALLVAKEDKNFALGCHSTPSPLPHT